jgi:hypothetical protein
MVARSPPMYVVRLRFWVRVPGWSLHDAEAKSFFFLAVFIGAVLNSLMLLLLPSFR